NAVQLLGPFMQGEVAWFPLEQKAKAIAWITKRSTR
ncbi:MAG: STAS/SEC14 domain-containing protein, partial [Shewanella sp.]